MIDVVGALIDLAGARRERRKLEAVPDILISTPNGECEGCGALRSLVSVTHDTGLRDGVSLTFLTLPHWRCDGRVVTAEEPSLAELETGACEPDTEGTP